MVLNKNNNKNKLFLYLKIKLKGRKKTLILNYVLFNIKTAFLVI